MSKGDKKNIMGRRKPKTTQRENPTEVDGRDLFQTPNYATRLLLNYLPISSHVVWEPAAGDGKIADVLMYNGYMVIETDLLRGAEYNFLTFQPKFRFDVIVTNPPFSLKRKFYERCRDFGKPFALLIPADYSGWLIKAVNEDRCEKIIPTRRIDYITPTGLSGASGHTAYYHSMWLTWGFGLGQTETFVELSLEDKTDI